MIAAVTVSAAVISAVFSFFIIKPVYEAKSTMVISKSAASDDKNDTMQYNDLMMYDKLVKTYAVLAKSNLITGEAVRKSGINITYSGLQDKLTVTPGNDTQTLEFSVRDNDPETAMKLTNMLAEVFVDDVKTIMNTQDTVKIMDEAILPKSPVRPRKLLNIAIAGFLGLMVSVGVAFLMEHLDNTIKTEDDVEKYLGLTVLASIPFAKAES